MLQPLLLRPRAARPWRGHSRSRALPCRAAALSTPAVEAATAAAPQPVAAAEPAAETSMSAAQTSEEAGYKKRAEESKAAGVQLPTRPPAGGDAPPPGSWSWTLNWDYLEVPTAPCVEHERPLSTTVEQPETEAQPQQPLVLGSCPRSADDVARIARESGATAILSLQSDDCFTALGVDCEAVKAAAAAHGILWCRVVIRDFDRLDQAAALPDAVRVLNALLALGRVPYVHCTAGINRAPLTVVGLLTFARGWSLDDALKLVRGARPQANPYAVPWAAARANLLAGRNEELYGRAAKAASIDEGGDWIARDLGRAEAAALMDTFARRAVTDVALMEGFHACGGGKRLLSSNPLERE